jgi:DNA-binding Lrp family transcriptional regulator
MKKITSSNKNKAINFRKSGLSYNDISNKLNIPKSTLSNWLKDLPLSKVIKKKNLQKTKLIWAKNIIAYNKKRSQEYKLTTEQKINNYSNEIKNINKKDLFYLGIGLFLAEGGKKEKFSIRFANSDPIIIKIIMKFFREICEVEDKNFKFRIHIHPNIIYSNTLKYWSKITKISEKQFYSPQIAISKASRFKRNPNTLPNGTLHITIMNAELRKKIKGWSVGIAKYF